MNPSKLTLENLKEVRGDLKFNDLSAEIIRRYDLFPELVKALEDLVNDGECYCADEIKTSCGHCLAKELLTRANEIKI